MTATPDAPTAAERVVISPPESAFPKEEDAKALADEVDSGWWNNNRGRILRSIGET